MKLSLINCEDDLAAERYERTVQGLGSHTPVALHFRLRVQRACLGVPVADIRGFFWTSMAAEDACGWLGQKRGGGREAERFAGFSFARCTCGTCMNMSIQASYS